MNLIEVTKKFQTKESCTEYLAALRWPDGIECMKCGVVGNDQFRQFKTNETTRKRYSKRKQAVVEVKVPARRLYECKGCGYQFSATTGTIFHDSHLPIEKWFQAVGMILEAKKGMSALQVCRHLGVPEGNYKSIWYLCHRIREATKESGLLTGVVEADETYMTRRKKRKGHPRVTKQDADVVFGMMERGGRLRLIPVPNAKKESIEPEILKNIGPNALLQTDESGVYVIIGKNYFRGRHRTINHIRTYGIGENHTNSIENAFSLLKKGVYGTFHHVSIRHLGRYCNEFSYRFNRRGVQSEMFEETVKGLLKGKPLPYKTLTTSETAES